MGSSWTPRGQQPSPPTNGVGGSNRATPTSTVSQQQQVANLTEAEALLQLSHFQESDEGIVSDQSSVADPEDPRIKVSYSIFFLYNIKKKRDVDIFTGFVKF